MRSLFSRFSHIRVPCENVNRFSEDVVGLGLSKTMTLTASQTLAVESLLDQVAINARSNVSTFDRVLVNGVVLHTLDYSAAIKRCDSFFTLYSHTGVFALHSCINLSGSNELIFISIILLHSNSEATMLQLWLTCCIMFLKHAKMILIMS